MLYCLGLIDSIAYDYQQQVSLPSQTYPNPIYSHIDPPWMRSTHRTFEILVREEGLRLLSGIFLKYIITSVSLQRQHPKSSSSAKIVETATLSFISEPLTMDKQ